MPENGNPLLSSSVEQACRFHRPLFGKAIEISSMTGLTVGDVLERIAHICDLDDCPVNAFAAFDEDCPVRR